MRNNDVLYEWQETRSTIRGKEDIVQIKVNEREEAKDQVCASSSE